VPRALHRRGKLDRLITEFWADPGTLAGRIGPARVRDRYHPDLAGATVESWNVALLMREVVMRLHASDPWSVIMDRNEWFQTRAVRALDRIRDDQPRVVFAYSYAALRILERARERGWRTILGQIDPGLVEDRLVTDLHRRHSQYVDAWASPPPAYWGAWRRECEIAERIVVNSNWSRDSLVAEGVPADKIAVVPLSYEAPKGSAEVRRTYPAKFSAERPLRVLFLGQLILRKGIVETLEAAAMLQREPVEFWIVGREHAKIPAALRHYPNVKWLGSVPRSQTAEHYRNADVFLFPTHSDGFGLTQLEAQAWKLPVIASRNGGDVIRDGENGVLLPAVTALAIVEAVRGLLANPERLPQFSERHLGEERFGLDFLADSLTALAH
jgi:glycosyltransferase involved in cell wall biosynthesis